jgi:hypothetical protein
LEQDLDEDTATGSSFVFIQMNDRKHVPTDCIGSQQMAEEAGNVAQAVCLVPMDSIVVLGKRLFEQIRPQSVKLGEALPDQPEEFGICLFLRAALDDHRW